MPQFGFNAFTPQPSNGPMPSTYQATGGYQAQTDSYQPAQNPPTVSSGKGLSVPAGAQDQYDAWQGGKSSAPLMNSATGHQLDGTGQVDESVVNKNSLWQRLGLKGRLGAGLDTGSMLASMIPQGATIGENIAGVAGAIHNLPYAELMHQYQMAAPALERAKEMAGLQLTQAQTQEAQARGEYFSTRNQASILAQQLRGQSAEQLRAQSGKAQPYWGVAPDDGVSPNGTPWKKGQQVWGYRIPNYVPGDPNNPTDPGSLQYTFEPHSVEDEEMKARWGMGGGHSIQGMAMQQYMQNYPRGMNGNLDPSNPKDAQALQDEALAHFEKISKVDPAIAAVTGNLGAKGEVPDKEGQAQIAKADDESYQRLKKIKPGIKEEDSLQNDTVAWATAQNSQDPKVREAAGDSPFDYHTKTQQANLQHDAQLDQARSAYLQQPPAQRKGFTNYLLQNGYDPQTRSFKQGSQQPQVINQGGTPGTRGDIYWDGATQKYRDVKTHEVVQ